MHAARPRPALHLINQLLADVVESSSADGPGSAAGERYDALARQGNAALQALAADSTNDAHAEVAAFKELQAVRELLAAERRRDYPRALQQVSELSFLPHEHFRLQHCVQGVASLHPALAKLLPAVLLTSARVLAAARQAEQLHLLVAFAGAMPHRIGQRVYQQIVQLDAEVA